MKKIILAIFFLLICEPRRSRRRLLSIRARPSRFVTGSPAGDLFDLYVRTVGQFMVKHIPGSPDVIVQNMPGAGHIIAANYVYNIAKPDGLTLAGTLATLYIDQLIGRSGGQVRLGQVYVDRQRWKITRDALYAGRQPLQDH